MENKDRQMSKYAEKFIFLIKGLHKKSKVTQDSPFQIYLFNLSYFHLLCFFLCGIILDMHFNLLRKEHSKGSDDCAAGSTWPKMYFHSSELRVIQFDVNAS